MAESRLQSLVGNDLADDYVRTYAPKSRWSDAWSLFKSNFVKFVIINVLTLLFFVPSIAAVYFRIVYLTNIATLYPFSANVGMAIYTPAVTGMAERLTLSADIIFYAILVLTGFIASIGLSGAAYSVKKMINSHGQFTVKGYFHGVRRCYFNTLLPVMIFMIFLFASMVVSDWAAMEIAYGASAAGPITAKVFAIIATVIVGLFGMWLYAVGVSYKVGLGHLFKNSFVLFVGTIVQSIFMTAFALIPVWLMVLCSVVMGCGTSVGGEKIIRSVGMDMVKLEKYQGFSADVAASLCLLFSSLFGIPVSTTHTKTSAIMGVGASRRLSAINFSVVRDMMLTWVFTFPGCGIISYLMARLFLFIF